jgi:hypothetical protein
MAQQKANPLGWLFCSAQLFGFSIFARLKQPNVVGDCEGKGFASVAEPHWNAECRHRSTTTSRAAPFRLPPGLETASGPA